MDDVSEDRPSSDFTGSRLFLHLVQPDRKFLDPIRSVFEAAAPGRHRYVVVGPLAEGQTLPPGAVHLRQTTRFRDVFSSESEWDGVVIHGLPFEIVAQLVGVFPDTVAVAWYVWGAEAYEFWPALSQDLLLPETRRLADRLAPPAWKQWAPRRSWLRQRPERAICKVASRYDFCVVPFREEYDLFVETGILRSTQFHWGSYGSIEDYVDTSEGVVAGDDFQLGNSASITNNHLDALPLLCGAHGASRTVVLPLTYGNGPYRDAVINAARECLGERFLPLVDFVSPDEYANLLRPCGHVVMNHRRQQAVGNIFAALWRGARVYLNDTTVCKALTRQGFEIERIDDGLGVTRATALRPCSDEQARYHRDLLRDQLSRKRVLAETADLLDRLSVARRPGKQMPVRAPASFRATETS